MIEKPILFSAPMIRAILDGRKTQTRRIVKYPPFASTDEGLDIQLALGNIKCPYKCDRLWVRESWRWQILDGVYIYAADELCYGGNHRGQSSHQDKSEIKWKPSIHMPKIACRLFLDVASIRWERLQNISEEDAIAEGISPMENPGTNKYHITVDDIYSYNSPTAKGVFMMLWNHINGEESYDANPWVWVIEFKKV